MEVGESKNNFESGYGSGKRITNCIFIFLLCFPPMDGTGVNS